MEAKDVRTSAKGADTRRRVSRETMKQLSEAMRKNVSEAEPRAIVLGRALKSGQPIAMDDVTSYIGDRDQGVIPGTDIRTDRFEIARVATEKMSERQIKRRSPAIKEAGAMGVVDGKESSSQ